MLSQEVSSTFFESLVCLDPGLLATGEHFNH